MNRNIPLVSIISPSLNQAQFLEQCILSVKGQSYSRIEHIIIDGGSDDGTIDILKHFEPEYNLRWISERDKGQSDAINKGFQLAKGEIFGWVNSDDTYLPGTVDTIAEYFMDHPTANWLYGDAYWIDKRGTVLSIYEAQEFVLKDLAIKGMYIPQPTIFVRREVLDDVGLLDTDIHTTMDYDLCLRMGRRFHGSYLPKILATRRFHLDAKSYKVSMLFANDSINALRKFFSDPNLPSDLNRVRGRAYSKRYLVGGYRSFNTGDFKVAFRMLFKSLKLDPRPWRKDLFEILLVMFESLIGISLIRPGFSRRQAERKFQKNHGEVNVSWMK